MSSVLNVNSSAIAGISQAEVHVPCDQTLHQYEQPKLLGALYIIAKSASATKPQHTRDCCWLTPAASPAISPCTHWCSSQADQRSRSPTTIYITHHCAATSNNNNTPSHTVMNSVRPSTPFSTDTDTPIFCRQPMPIPMRYRCFCIDIRHYPRGDVALTWRSVTDRSKAPDADAAADATNNSGGGADRLQRGGGCL